MDSELVKGKPLTKEEAMALLDLIEGNKIVTTKTTNATNNLLKTEEWIRIANTFNAGNSSSPRTPQQLRLKWENMKKNARKRRSKMKINSSQGNGISEYFPPDDVLDRVTSLLDGNSSSFFVPFGGDSETSGVDVSGDGEGGSSEEAKDGVSEDAPSLELPQPVASVLPAISASTPMFSLNSLKAGRKKQRISDDGRKERNFAIEDYYKTKKIYLNAKLENIILQNKKLKLENEKLRYELYKNCHNS